MLGYAMSKFDLIPYQIIELSITKFSPKGSLVL